MSRDPSTTSAPTGGRPLRLRPSAARAAVAAFVALAAGACSAAEAEDAAQSVVITATRHAMPERDAPASMTVVTRREIEARGADNLLEALRGQTGLTLQGRSIGGRKVLSIRGLDSKHTLFLVDGRRVAASDGVVGHSDFQYDWIPVEDIERIEVVRGPMSVLYGSEALGGVVNVITRQPGDAWRFGAAAGGSEAAGDRGGNGARFALGAGGPLAPDLSLRAGVAATRVDALASPTDPRISELEGKAKDDGWVGLSWRAAGTQRVDFEHRVGREEREADARERTGKRRYHHTVNDLERVVTSLGWDAEWAVPTAPQPLATGLRAYRSTIDVENRRTEGVAVNPPQRLADVVLEGQARQALDAHGVTGGFEMRNESLADPGLPGGESTARHRSLFAQDELALAAGLMLTAGLRYDWHELYGAEWSPRAYLVWRARPQWIVKGGYGHGFKAPNLKQIVPGARAEGPNTFLGNPDLKPETSDGVEVGVGWTPGGTDLELTLFHQRVEDLIEVRLVKPGAVPGIGTYTYANQAQATFRGVEASWVQPLVPGLRASLNYTYLDARDDSGERLEKRPRHSGAVKLDWEGGALRAGLRAEYTGEQLLPAPSVGAPAQPAGGFTQFGAYVALALPRGLDLTLVVDNLTDVRLSEQSPLFTHVEPPRTVQLTLRGRW